MPVVEKVTLNILSDSELKLLENKIVKLESLAERKQAATNEIGRKKKSLKEQREDAIKKRDAKKGINMRAITP